MAGQDPVVCAERVVKLMHRIDDRLDLACRRVSGLEGSLCKGWTLLTIHYHLRDVIQQFRSDSYLEQSVGQERYIQYDRESTMVRPART